MCAYIRIHIHNAYGYVYIHLSLSLSLLCVCLSLCLSVSLSLSLSVSVSLSVHLQPLLYLTNYMTGICMHVHINSITCGVQSFGIDSSSGCWDLAASERAHAPRIQAKGLRRRLKRRIAPKLEPSPATSARASQKPSCFGRLCLSDPI